jgi:hypothetical protein
LCDQCYWVETSFDHRNKIFFSQSVCRLLLKILIVMIVTSAAMLHLKRINLFVFVTTYLLSYRHNLSTTIDNEFSWRKTMRVHGIPKAINVWMHQIM